MPTSYSIWVMNSISKPKIHSGKKLGQHFLKSQRIAQQIVELARIEDERVLEIGAGKGMLTHEIAKGAQSVYAVEIDKNLCNFLKEKDLPNTVVINKNFLDIDLRDYPNSVVIGNIPYYLTTPIIEKLIRQRKFFKRAVLTIQKEYGERILATPGEKSYGSITLYVNYYFSVKKGFIIPAHFFYPRPKVSSMVILLKKRRPFFRLNDQNEFFDFIRGIFCYRRKCLKNCLINYLGYLPDSLNESIIKKRPEDLSLTEFKELYDRIH